MCSVRERSGCCASWACVCIAGDWNDELGWRVLGVCTLVCPRLAMSAVSALCRFLEPGIVHGDVTRAWWVHVGDMARDDDDRLPAAKMLAPSANGKHKESSDGYGTGNRTREGRISVKSLELQKGPARREHARER